MKGAPHLAHLHWWTTRGERASDKRREEATILKRVAQAWAGWVVHVFDQGYAGSPWVLKLLSFPGLRFVIRWKKGYKLLGQNGEAKLAWKLLRGKRSMDQREIWDARRRSRRTVGILYCPVSLPENSQPLWLVASRPGLGRKPWYLLTNLPIHSVEQAWHIVFIYARRWQVEMTLRFEKSELGFESPRLQNWEARCKLLLIAALVHAFLILLLEPHFDRLRLWLLDTWCHRNGKWSRDTPTPLYRLRLALSQLWRTFPPSYPPLLNSG
jgi:transposase